MKTDGKYKMQVGMINTRVNYKHSFITNTQQSF